VPDPETAVLAIFDQLLVSESVTKLVTTPAAVLPIEQIATNVELATGVNEAVVTVVVAEWTPAGLLASTARATEHHLLRLRDTGQRWRR
jgi:hypothetical protein